MSATNSVSVKRETLNLRIKPAECDLIDQRIIMADPDAYQEFLARLDQVASPNAALRKTMQTPDPWEQKK
ncbi:DUF1778 domain-containing protein [Pectobacterium brasiliense]|uniref:type II toxin-antitoxin system TacA family antitoxin n=1 Tax=Pectobacterium brasiliense TaxID=180957 RepID=UPI00057FA80A|nr:DUF1778 domain-containing protein [Pectobacterium brasiliense]KHS72132.1 CopG family transcriptional regulator [Pectobacterium brasiliense]QSD37521.1 DUF1778 domain-containing protein [Pectobacterium brasiliense]